MPWKFVVCDETGLSIGEPRATGRSLNVAVSSVATATFTITDTDPMWPNVAAETNNLKVFNSAGQLVFYGPIISSQETASGQGATVQYTASDQSWVLTKRFTGKDLGGIGDIYTNIDSGLIMSSIITRNNSEKPTGVTLGTVGTFIGQTVTYLWKNDMDALNELGAMDGSYEWGISYTDGAGGTVPTCALNLVPQMGSDRSATVFLEYGQGTRHNCGGYTMTASISNIATAVWALGNGSASVVEAEDVTAEAFQRYEDVVTFSDISDVSLLATLATAHVAVRKQPQTLLQMTPFPATAPRYGVDWAIGDRVSARVVTSGSVRASGVARVWGAQILIDDLGTEASTLTLQPGGS